MTFVQDDDVVQTLAPDRADYPFDVRILPGGSGSRHDFLDAHGGNRGPEGRAGNAVSVPDQVPRPCGPGEGLPDLLCNPRGRRLYRDRNMHDPAPVMAKHHEDEENGERRRRGGEKVDGHQASDLVPQKRSPRLRGWPRVPDHVLGDGCLGNPDPELERLAVDPGRTPEADSPGSSGGRGCGSQETPPAAQVPEPWISMSNIFENLPGASEPRFQAS